jgi:glycosyltransferase involved in cell wall biosynthesis
MVIRGFLDMDDLVSMLASARAVIVPVFVGEGSNLKSADALATGVPVIMTERATRGYEDVIAADPEGITVVDDAADFRRAMRHAIDRPRSGLRVGVQRRDLLRWSSRLERLVGTVQTVGRRGADERQPAVPTADDTTPRR